MHRFPSIRQTLSSNILNMFLTVDGKIFVRNNREFVTTITTDYGLKRYILDNFPNAMEIAYPPAKEPRASNIPPQFQSYSAAVLPGGSGP
jgi:hypothetical protein